MIKSQTALETKNKHKEDEITKLNEHIRKLTKQNEDLKTGIESLKTHSAQCLNHVKEEVLITTRAYVHKYITKHCEMKKICENAT